MSDEINERVARLEAKMEVVSVFLAEDAADRKALHMAVDALNATLQEWKSSQRGYLAGLASVVGVLVWLVTVGWEWIVRHAK